jgi:hypothetical protein
VKPLYVVFFVLILILGNEVLIHSIHGTAAHGTAAKEVVGEPLSVERDWSIITPFCPGSDDLRQTQWWAKGWDTIKERQVSVRICCTEGFPFTVSCGVVR